KNRHPCNGQYEKDYYFNLSFHDSYYLNWHVIFDPSAGPAQALSLYTLRVPQGGALHFTLLTCLLSPFGRLRAGLVTFHPSSTSGRRFTLFTLHFSLITLYSDQIQPGNKLTSSFRNKKV